MRRSVRFAVRVIAAGVLISTAGCGHTRSTPQPTEIALPPVAGVADYQLGGAYPPRRDVEIVVRDRTDKPAADLYSVCYVNAFQTQPDAADWWSERHPNLLLTSADGPVEDPGWPGEFLFDVSTAHNRERLMRIVDGWFSKCARDGFDAIEPDNLDSFSRSNGLLTKEDAVAFAELLIESAHRHGLAIAQKNTVEIDGATLGFDFAVAEECAVFAECGDYQRMYGGRVIEIEYSDNGRKAFEQACADASGQRSILLRDRDVTPVGDSDYIFETCDG